MVDEDRYREAYRELNARPCVFERALLTGRCGCRCHRRLLLAEREAAACEVPAAQARCAALLEVLRDKARFALGLTGVAGPLPFGKEIKVQAGGLLGLQAARYPDRAAGRVEDVDALLEEALARYGGLDRLPIEAMVRHIVHYRPRRR